MRCRGPEAYGGRSANSVIYQGETQSEATTIHAQFPSSLQAGGAPATFTITLDNPSADPVPSARIDFSFFPGDGTKATVRNQLDPSHSTNGANGPFTDIALTGDTASGDDIEGYPGPLQGSTLPRHRDVHLPSERRFVGASRAGRPRSSAIEAYLDQID